MVSNAWLSLACFCRLLATFLVAESKCQIRSSLKRAYFSSTSDSPGEMQAWEVAGHVVSAVRREREGGKREEGGEEERERASEGPTDFPIIQSGDPSSCGGVLRVGLASSVQEILSQTHPQSCFQGYSKCRAIDNGE